MFALRSGQGSAWLATALFVATVLSGCTSDSGTKEEAAAAIVLQFLGVDSTAGHCTGQDVIENSVGVPVCHEVLVRLVNNHSSESAPTLALHWGGVSGEGASEDALLAVGDPQVLPGRKAEIIVKFELSPGDTLVRVTYRAPWMTESASVDVPDYVPDTPGTVGDRLAVTNVAATTDGGTAQVTWVVGGSTGVRSRVEYGTTTNYGESTAYKTGTGAKQQQLLNLQSGATYHYRVHAVDGTRTVESADATFVTIGASSNDVFDPVVLEVTHRDVTRFSARVSWNVEDESSVVQSWVRYGTTATNLDQESAQQAGNGSKTATLSGLTLSTTYSYVVIARDGAGNEAESTVRTFTTAADPDTEAPTITGVSTSTPSSSGVTVFWSVSDNADNVESWVTYGTTSTSLSGESEHRQGKTTQSAALTGLNPNTQYFYRVQALDPSQNPAESDVASFTTSQVANNPPQISTVSSSNVGQTGATLTWSVTDDGPGVQSYARYGTTPNTYTQQAPDPKHTGTGTKTVSLTALASGTQYFYKVYADDGVNPIVVTATERTFTTTAAPVAPTLNTPTVSVQTPTSFQVSWTVTGESDVTSKVRYGLDTSYTGGEVVGSAGPGSKTITVSGLPKGQGLEYHFIVVAESSAGNTATTDQTARTRQFIAIDIVSTTPTNDFDPADVTLKGDYLWSIEVDNVDPSFSHSWTVMGASGDFDTGVFSGSAPIVTLNPTTSLLAGTYNIVCALHSGMGGTLTVS